MRLFNIKSWRKFFISILFIGLYVAALVNGDNWVLYTFYTIAVAFLIRSIGVGRFSFFYATFALFFVLGNWLKLSVHRIFDYPYVEPIGLFSGTESEWSAYFINSTIIAIAMISAKVGIDLFVPGRKPKLSSDSGIRISHGRWLALSLFLLIAYTINFFLGFYRTGVGAALILPFGLGALVAFIFYLGFPLIVATHVSMDLSFRREFRRPAFVTLILLGVALSISTASRASMIIQISPVLIGVVLHSRSASYGANINKKLIGFVFATLLALVGVTLYRIAIFYDSTVLNSDLLLKYLNETSDLVVDRWIGVESMMVSASSHQASPDLFLRLLTEDPTTGVDSIYQALAGSFYSYMAGKTFLTLPGIFAILALSGSQPLIFAGVSFVVIFGILFERFASLMTYRRLPVVVLVCVALANSFAQTAFPRLLLPFVFQLTMLLIALRLMFPKTGMQVRGGPLPN